MEEDFFAFLGHKLPAKEEENRGKINRHSLSIFIDPGNRRASQFVLKFEYSRGRRYLME